MAKKVWEKVKSGKFDRSVIIGIIIAVLVIALTLWGPLRKFRVAEEKKPVIQAQKQEPLQKKTAKKSKKDKKETKKHSESLVAGSYERTVPVAIVIDDLGQDVKQAKEVLALSGKITLAVLPGLAQSTSIAELAKQSGREVLLHLPMEPLKNHEKTQSPGTLSANMTPMAFMNTVSEDLVSVPGAVGVNNHEGSALTENKEAMKFLMAELKARNLFFLDSFTNPKSVAYATAIEFGMKAAKRDVFLDNEGDNPAYIRKQLDELVDIARKHGKAIGIGHPHPATLSELRKWLAEIGAQGIEIVPVSRLMQ
ncbi:MAG: divergent polysaccharide deacetylase family protein [Nitrospirae bacterium]|nr:divergent polysaccharide deacetylase family protein [Nitrospirota bacterium]